jgi:hypothetical protein
MKIWNLKQLKFLPIISHPMKWSIYTTTLSLSLSSQTTVQFIFLFCFINTNFTEDLDNHESSI